LRKLLLNILPQSLINFYKKIKKNKRLSERKKLIAQNNIVTQQEVIQTLKEVGVTEGDVIMLHSSLSKIGFVQDGAQNIINSFITILKKSGTLVMPAFPAMGFNFDYLKTNPVFDIKNTPSKMGIVTEEFRKMQSVKRSLHPTDSVCAFGLRADEITNTHYNQLTSYNQHSPFYKLVELKAKIVLLGVDLNALTNFHTLEDAVDDFKFPVYHSDIFTAQLIDEDDVLKTMQTKVHNPVYSKKRQCNVFIKPFINEGFMKSFTIGMATCYIIDADKMHTWMLDNYVSKGITLYTPQGS
jgi:aminoglycoside 3-N-acetyltransferase